jgi:drug/metabolite transporter (DMT)-like permease
LRAGAIRPPPLSLGRSLQAFFSLLPSGLWAGLILSGVLYGTGQFLLIRALAAAPANILTPFTYTQIVAAVLFGMLVLGELPNPWTFVGTALIVLAGLYVVRWAR